MRLFDMKSKIIPIQSQHFLRSWIFFLTLVVSLATGSFFPTQIHAATQGKRSVNGIPISEYKEQIRFIDMEINTLQSNMNFLKFKVERMKIESRFVPPKMKESIEFKKSKLKALRALRNHYQNIIGKKKKPSVAPARPKQTKKTKLVHKASKGNIDKKIINRVKDAGLADWLEPISQAPCTYLTTRLPILFSSGSAKIPKGYQSFLKKLAGFLKNYDVRILVKGYADTDPIHTKKYPSNLELGASRAGAIARALIGYGIKPSVFEVASTGEYRFISQKPVKWKNLQRHATIQILFPDCRKP